MFGAQRNAHHAGLEFDGRGLRERAPATADLQHTTAFGHAGAVECAPYLGVLSLRQRCAQVPLKPGAGVIHRRIEPLRVKRVAQVVVCVDVLAAVGLGIVFQQMLDSVKQAAAPGAVNDLIDLAAVCTEKLEQLAELGCIPIARDVALGKADVARLQGGCKHVPVVQAHTGHRPGLSVVCMGVGVLTKASHRSIGQLQG